MRRGDKETRPHVAPGTEFRAAKPTGDDSSTVYSGNIIPGKQVAVGTVSAVQPESDAPESDEQLTRWVTDDEA
jgi:hypothetical protein